MRLHLLMAIALLTSCFRVASAETQRPETQPVLLQMVRDDAIHQELKLSSDQVDQIRAALKPIDGPWFRVRIRPVQERIETIQTLTEQLENALQGILTAEQTKRLDQLRNQALGTRMIVRDQVVEVLGIEPSERESIYQTFRKTDAVVKEMQEKVSAGEMDSKQAAAEVRQAKQAERKRLTDGLSTEQRIKLVDLTGESFDFSRVKRTYPVAPELTLEGAQWLQGSGLQLEDLRGKVVAVHFYAFQCINCRRNLPHYNAWQTDYADDGLVIIGIQTPETSRERKPDEVAAAMKRENIEYPVLMDSQSANWRQWSNTMWPTVYLIDKQGYLRRWWQGELNWKETPGEQQMRQTIEQLLAEDG